MDIRAQSGSCIPWLLIHLFRILLLQSLFSGAEAIRNFGRRLDQFLIPFYPGSLACGNTFTCGLQANGTAFCWGKYNEFGQLGTNSTNGTIAPVAISGNNSFVKLSAGQYTTCGLQTDLTAWCWGLNDQGQAGAFNQSQPVDASLFTPTPIFGNSTWLEISLGRTFGCGIKTNRSLWCWGTTFYGALGNGIANSTALVPQPVTNPENLTWDRVACGLDFACAITSNGSLYCWGNNEFGQTGTDTTQENSQNLVLVPTIVPLLNDATDRTWVDIFIGSASQFAFATQSDSSGWSWGDGRTGTLAIDSIDVLFKPTQMLTPQTWNYIAGGSAQAVGIADNSEGLSWGTGYEGQLGAGVILNVSVGPVKISTPDGADIESDNTVSIGVWADVCANSEQSCGIYNSDAYCWGSSTSWLLGSPGGDASYPRLVEGNGTWGVRQFAPPPAPLASPPPPRPPAPPPAPKHPPPPPVTPVKSTGASVGEIVGAAVGGVALASLLLVGYMVWRRKRRQKRNALGNNSNNNSDNKNNAKPDAVLLWAAHSQEMESPRASLIPLIPPNLAPLEFNWNDVEVLKPLGTGSFGAVYLANIHHTKMAVKVLVDADAVVAAAASASHSNTTIQTPSSGKNLLMSSKSLGGIGTSSVPKAHIEKMLQEASLMATLQHPNVVHLLGFCISPPCMAVEYCPRGSLYDVLAQGRTDPEGAKRLTWIRRLRMAKDVAAGLLHLHSRTPPILHRDVKSPNILVSADMTVKVADMGLSKLAEEAQGGSKVSTMGGGANPRWLAPEILGGQKASMESDVFAFGVVLWEMLTWELPWSEDNVWVVSSAVLRGERPDIPPYNQLPGFEKGITPAQDVSISNYIGLMKRCWAQNPVERPDFSIVAEELGELLREHGGAKSKQMISTT